MKQIWIGAAALALIASPALSADMPAKAPLYKAPPPPVWSWTGFYVGAHAGYGEHGRTVGFFPNDPLSNFICIGVNGSTCPPPAAFDVRGGLGGVQGGYNWQFAPAAVAGIEADFSWSGIRGSGVSNFLISPIAVPPGTSSIVTSQRIRSFGTVRARLGWLPTQSLLLYATAGFAYGRIEEDAVLSTNPGRNAFALPAGFSCLAPANVNCFLGARSRNASGWTAGGGVEFAPWDPVSIKLEYLYVDLGPGDVFNLVAVAVPPPATIASSFAAVYSRNDFHVVRVGLNWRFGGGPLVARY